MYQPFEGRLDCEVCPPGYYCLSNTSVPIDCPVQSYCPAGSIEPTLCEQGTFNNITNLYNASQCAECPIGELLYF